LSRLRGIIILEKKTLEAKL